MLGHLHPDRGGRRTPAGVPAPPPVLRPDGPAASAAGRLVRVDLIRGRDRANLEPGCLSYPPAFDHYDAVNSVPAWPGLAGVPRTLPQPASSSVIRSTGPDDPSTTNHGHLRMIKVYPAAELPNIRPVTRADVQTNVYPTEKLMSACPEHPSRGGKPGADHQTQVLVEQAHSLQ